MLLPAKRKHDGTYVLVLEVVPVDVKALHRLKDGGEIIWELGYVVVLETDLLQVFELA